MASPSKVEGIHRLTPTQEGILFHAVQGAEEGLYVQQFTCELVGPLDEERFRAAWQATVDRHQALRSLFTWKKRPHPLQVAKRDVELNVQVIDDAALVGGGDALEAWLRADRAQGVELERAPTFRLTLVRGEDPTRHRLLWTFHHIALDGWSMRVALHEALARYAGQEPSAPAPTTKSYIDWLAAQSPERALEHWRNALGGFESANEFFQVARPAQGSDHVTRKLRLPEELTAATGAAARAAGVTLNVVMRMAWSLALARVSGSRDIVFGATVSGRPPEIEGIEGLVGMCINTVPVRVRLEDAAAVRDACRGLQADLLDALPYETASLAEIQRASELPPGDSLFHSILVMENHAAPPALPEGALRMESAHYEEKSHYPLALLVVPGDELELLLVHDREKVADGEAAALLESVQRTLQGITATDSITIGELLQLSKGERATLEAWGRRELAAPSSTPDGDDADDVLTAIDTRAAQTPETEALRCHESGTLATITYGELKLASERVAHELMRRGVSPGNRVGVRLERGHTAITVILGVLRAGAAYVPIDPKAPSGRVEAFCEAAGVRLVIGIDGVEASAFMDAPTGDAARLPGADPGGIAYVLFTSGSTGTPKGVEISRGALRLSTNARQDVYGEGPERFLLLSPLHFDSSVAGLFWTLTTGGTLVLPAPGSERDARTIARLFGEERITHTLMLPSLYGVALETSTPDQRSALRTVIVAGEAATASLVAAHHRAAPGVRLENEYGPTEATVWATSVELTPEDASDPVPIGRPIGPVEAHVLDHGGQHVAPGVAGELYLGGPTLAEGYAAGATPERFGPRWSGGPRLYATGDRVRYRADGQLLFLGRIDRQVKIRGHRIELGEVEAGLLALDGVDEAAVVVATAPSGQRQLVGFASGALLAADGGAELKAALAGALPPAMVPQRIATGPLPTTASGKIDRPRLAQQAAEALATAESSDAGGRAPVGEVETTLHALWKEVLGLESISADADFYSLGGDSLTSIRLVSRAHKAGYEVDLGAFAADPTIEGMARAAQTDGAAAPPAAGSETGDTDREFSGPVPLTPIQRWFLRQDLPERNHWNQAVRLRLPISGDPAPETQALGARLRALVARHDGLRVRVGQAKSGWQARVASIDEAEPSIVNLDSRDLEPSEADAVTAQLLGELQVGLDLDSGPVIGAVLVTGAAEIEAFIVAHHFVVDAVSWSTIMDELRAEPTADPGSTYASWADALAQRAQQLGPETAPELVHWKALTSPHYGMLGAGPGEVTAEAVVTATLDRETTTSLLSEIHDAYGTRPREILIAALSRTLARQTGMGAHLVDIEGHGREALAIQRTDLDVSRSIGWFTNVWPLALVEPQAPTAETLAASVIAAKEAVRSTPAAGMDFGLLEYAEDATLRAIHADVPPRDVLFNYLGQMDASGASPMEALDDPRLASLLGPLRSPKGTRAYPIEVNLWVAEGALVTRWSHGPAAAGFIDDLTANFLEEVRALVQHCLDPHTGSATPSDFPMADVDQAELDRISKLLGGG